MPDLTISVGESVATEDRMGGSPPPRKPKGDGGEQVAKEPGAAKSVVARLFECVQMFARPPMPAVSTYLSFGPA